MWWVCFEAGGLLKQMRLMKQRRHANQGHTFVAKTCWYKNTDCKYSSFIIGLLQRSGTVVYWLSMPTHNTGVFSPNPPRFTLKMLLAIKVTGTQPIKSTSLEKSQSPAIGFCYAGNRVWDEVEKLLQRKKFF